MPIIVDKEKKQKQLIEAAMAVFTRTGYRRAKMKDIADEAGVGKGTVYEYFRSKQELFLRMCEYVFEQFLMTQKKALDSEPDPEQQIRTVISSAIEQAIKYTGLVYLTVDVWSEMDRIGEEDKLRRLMADVYERMANVLAGYIRSAQGPSRVFKDYDARLVALIIMAVLDGIYSQLVINKQMFDPKAMAGTLTDVLLHGLRK